MGVLTTVVVIVIFMIIVAVATVSGYFYYRGTLKEVYVYYPGPDIIESWSEATSAATKLGGAIADMTQLTCAFNAGGQWCNGGWLADGENGPESTSTNIYYPMQEAVSGCGDQRGIIKGTVSGYDGYAGVLVYGVKSKKGSANLKPFNTASGQWSMWDPRLQDLVGLSIPGLS